MNTFHAHVVPARPFSLALAVSGALALSALTGCGPQSNATPTPVPPVASASPQQPVAPTSQAAYPAPAPVQPAYPQQQPYQPQPVPAYPQPAQPMAQPVPQTPTAASPPAYAQAPVYAQDPAPAPRVAPRAPAHREPVQVASNRIGRVSSIEPIRERPQGTGAGGVVGGVLGAVVGNQFGGGNGRTAMTVLGAAGGAVAGNNVERNIHTKVVGYRVSVQLDNGQVRSYEQSNLGDLQVGDRVRVEGQRLRRV